MNSQFEIRPFPVKDASHEGNLMSYWAGDYPEDRRSAKAAQ